MSFFGSFVFCFISIYYFLKKRAVERLFTHQIQNFVVTNMAPKTVMIMLMASLGKTVFQFSDVKFPKELNLHTIGNFLFSYTSNSTSYSKGLLRLCAPK